MSVNLTLLIVMGALYACGIYLILERSLTRVLLGLMLLANATNLLILATGGYAGLAPLFAKDTPAQDYNDPLPQALILTSIVISFAVTAFMLGIIYRTWVLARQDDIQDDLEDRRVAATPSFDAEDDAEVPAETSEFPLTMLGSDGRDVSNHSASRRGTAQGMGQDTDQPVATLVAGGREMPAEHAAAEEKPGSLNVDPGPEGGGK
jgi:multicomponent Na+:H+ antiporter subunit C